MLAFSELQIAKFTMQSLTCNMRSVIVVILSNCDGLFTNYKV